MAGDRDWKIYRQSRIVSIHARAWRATHSVATIRSAATFQFTPARGGRPEFTLQTLRRLEFQFTPARGGRPRQSTTPNEHLTFQFTPARGGRRWFLVYIPFLVWFQFTPARGGRPHQSRSRAKSKQVSIHARAWRATMECVGGRSLRCSFNSRPRVAGDSRCRGGMLLLGTFQFTPARGGRPLQRHDHHRPQRFNSRPRVARDQGGRHRRSVTRVSIHARAWRATSRAYP